jgi:hypothetical protein
MSTYRVVIQRQVVTHEYYIVQGENEDEAVENAQGGSYPIVSSDLQESSTDLMLVEEIK